MLKNKENGSIIALNIMKADSFSKRLRGLMFTKELSPQSALLIYPCSGIHTYFMNYSIDVLYLDIHNTILAIDEDLRPGRIGKNRKGAVAVIEIRSGRVKETDTRVGQVVEVV
jgi:uncharacterized protein